MEPVNLPEIWNAAYTYAGYRELLEDLMNRNLTTGPDQSEKLVAYAKLNLQRMRRVDKTVEIMPELHRLLAAFLHPQHWLVITEGWCGDAAQSVPAIAKAASVNPNIRLRFVLRDEHPEVMDRYLYKGTRSIPRLIVLDENFQELAVWGPRPQAAQQLVDQGKRAELPHDMWAEQVHAWYAQDRTRALQGELTEIFKLLA